MNGTQINLTDILGAQRDSYAKKQGAFIVAGEYRTIADAETLWHWMRDTVGGRVFRVVYETLDGDVRDMIGRQGVYDSEQDGTVLNVGHAMASEESLNLSFWTFAHGTKVNTGSGKGYRTLKAAGILALRFGKVDILTGYGEQRIRESL